MRPARGGEAAPGATTCTSQICSTLDESPLFPRQTQSNWISPPEQPEMAELHSALQSHVPCCCWRLNSVCARCHLLRASRLWLVASLAACVSPVLTAASSPSPALAPCFYGALGNVTMPATPFHSVSLDTMKHIYRTIIGQANAVWNN